MNEIEAEQEREADDETFAKAQAERFARLEEEVRHNTEIQKEAYRAKRKAEREGLSDDDDDDYDDDDYDVAVQYAPYWFDGDINLMAITQQYKSLLPVGVMDVQGDFDMGDVVEIVNAQKVRLVVGQVGFDSNQANHPKHTDEILQILSLNDDDKAIMVYRDDMAVLSFNWF